MKKREHIVFYGDVQGVGFRWKACQLAEQYDLTGWVRNEYDGSVTMEVQGENMALFVMIDRLKQDRWIRVKHMDVEEIPLIEKERSFGPLD